MATHGITKKSQKTPQKEITKAIAKRKEYFNNKQRQQYETDINAFLIGETIKKARLQRKLTQAQLGELMGVKRAQVSRIEGGRNLTFATLSRAFKAMGVAATIEAKGIGKVSLW